MAEKTVNDLVQELLQRDIDDLEVKRDRQNDVYKGLPALVQRVSELTGIEPTHVVRWSVQTAWHFQDTKWYEVLEMIRIFYQNKYNAEKESR